MIVVAYFHYNTGRSDISKHEDEESVKDHLYNRWSFLLDEKNISIVLDEISLDKLVSIFINEVELRVEILVL